MKYEDVELEVTINKAGEVKISVKGVKGKRCLVVTKDLEALLGGELIERKMHDEKITGSTPRIPDIAT